METDRNREITFGSIGAVVGLVLGFLVGLVLAWIYWSRTKEGRELPDFREAETERLALEPEHPAVGPMEIPQISRGPADLTVIEGGVDDLTVIEGIGPRFAGVLQNAGITTFVQLGACRPDEITAILHEEDPRLARLADPTTWPEQAILAAAGVWDALEDLQEMLKRGRRV